MSIVILDVDLGKNSCSIVGVGAAGAVVVRRSMRRQTLINYALKLPACVVAMEACCGAHHHRKDGLTVNRRLENPGERTGTSMPRPFWGLGRADAHLGRGHAHETVYVEAD